MTVRMLVYGIVQGVGFRPFVMRLAKERNLCGTVCNTGSSVCIDLEGDEEAIRSFRKELQNQAPEGSWIQEIREQARGSLGEQGFRILPSPMGGDGRLPWISPDLPTCGKCLEEMEDPSNRRFHHPFISCTACGPRYSILRRLPYDRENTSMEEFPLCEECRKEYREDRRRQHAQTIACPNCGPELRMGDLRGEAAYEEASRLLRKGELVGVKGIGGYQILGRPDLPETVLRLRELKGREKKPFAVMFADVDQVRQYVDVSEEEEKLLLSPARPIVLIEGRAFSAEVCGCSPDVGAFLPYSPLHHRLIRELGPLIVTSANRSSDPISWRIEQAAALSIPLLDHDRAIETPLDDSVARISAGAPLLIRRSRGYVPLPILLQGTFIKRDILAMGGDLKACFALAGEDRVYPSQYFGDMENPAVQELFIQTIRRMEELLGIRPEVVVTDLHPGYETGALARRLFGDREILSFQHHHAHVASVMAEYGLKSCIGVAYDGTGYGKDGTIWGGEFLFCRGREMERVAHLESIPFCGGNEGAKNARLALQSYRYAAGFSVNDPLVREALRQGIGTVKTSSMGRFFDAVSALLGICAYNHYEGECPTALEAAARRYRGEGYDLGGMEIDPDGRVDVRNYIRRLTEAAEAGVSAACLAWQFHQDLADMTAESCERIRRDKGENAVCLSGGVFVNRVLLETCVQKLKERRFDVYWNRQVPCGDGGICLGQAWLAAR